MSRDDRGGGIKLKGTERLLAGLIGLLLVLNIGSLIFGGETTPSAQGTPTPTTTASLSVTPTPTASLSVTPTPTDSLTAQPTQSASVEPSPTPSETPDDSLPSDDVVDDDDIGNTPATGVASFFGFGIGLLVLGSALGLRLRHAR